MQIRGWRGVELCASTVFLVAVVGAQAWAITYELPFYENFEPTPDHWNWTAEWIACDHPGNRTTCPDDPMLPLCTYPAENCSAVWGPYKFESWPDAANGGVVFSGLRSGRQPLQDPYWHTIMHPFTPPVGVGDLRLSLWQFDFAGILCDCDQQAQPSGYVCDCDSGQTPPNPSRPNFDVHGWLVLTEPYRTEYYVLAVNSKVSWTHVVWATKTDGWNVSSTARVPGWRKMEIVVHPYTGQVGDVEFLIDGEVVASGRRAPGSGTGVDVSWLQLGGDPALLTEGILTNTFEVFWYDEVALTFTPDPCPEVAMDSDDDGDLDQTDFSVFQLCYTGGGNTNLFNELDCHCVDPDGDKDVDIEDLAVFDECATGPGIPADPACGEQ